MRGGFFSSTALLLLGIGCGGATTTSPAEGQPGPAEASGGTAPSDEAPASSGGATPVSCDCVPFEIAWWRDGGLVPTSVHARIEPCADYVLEQDTSEPGVTEVCGSTLQGCSD